MRRTPQTVPPDASAEMAECGVLGVEGIGLWPLFKHFANFLEKIQIFSLRKMEKFQIFGKNRRKFCKIPKILKISHELPKISSLSREKIQRKLFFPFGFLLILPFYCFRAHKTSLKFEKSLKI